MNEYNARLTKNATQLFQSTLPTLCRRFHSVLESDEFSPNAVGKVRTNIKFSCEKLIRAKQRELIEAEEKKKQKELEEQKEREKEENRKQSRKKERTKKLIQESKQDHSDDEEFHTPMNSDSEDGRSSAPPRKRFKVQKKKKVKEISESDDEEEDTTKENAVLECNPHIAVMINTLKPELREVSECCNTVKAWVQLQVPEMQDGNNFGVQVQGDMLNEVTTVEAKSSAFMQTISMYHLSRAEIGSKFAKFPGVEDYVMSLDELDVKEFISLRLIAREMRNSCIGLLDSFKKNMDKIITPRSHNDNILVC